MIDLDSYPRVKLAHLPTPLEPMPRLTEALGGPDIWIKRDDCTGLATGGNKTRKLEFLMGAALAEGADTVITFGALQSNHVRQTVAAAAKLGLACEPILIRMVAGREPAYQTSGNLLLNQLLGARTHLVADVEEAMSKFTEISKHLQGTNHTTYVIPTGGSNPVGALGYVNCAMEIVEQAKELDLSLDTIVHASSSSGTQSGLVVGLASLDSPVSVLGINVYHEDTDSLLAEVTKLCAETAEFAGISAVSPDRICVNGDFLGEGYGIPTPETVDAIRMLARHEGILLDPVYAGKAMAGLIGLIREGRFSRDQTVLFVHTGGSVGLFAYRDLLANEAGPAYQPTGYSLSNGEPQEQDNDR